MPYNTQHTTRYVQCAPCRHADMPTYDMRIAASACRHATCNVQHAASPCAFDRRPARWATAPMPLALMGVRAQTRKFFRCETLEGMELEDQAGNMLRAVRAMLYAACCMLHAAMSALPALHSTLTVTVRRGGRGLPLRRYVRTRSLHTLSMEYSSAL